MLSCKDSCWNSCFHINIAQISSPFCLIGLCLADESAALDALHTLADISVNILQPSSNAESG
jgi:hypothetical protein